MASSNEIILDISSELNPDRLQSKEFIDALIIAINILITQDFSRLIQILYQVDVSEKQLKNLLKEQPGTGAAELIAALLIERQLEKINTRKKFAQEPRDIPDNESW